MHVLATLLLWRPRFKSPICILTEDFRSPIIILNELAMEHPRTDHLPQKPYRRFIPFYIRFTERAVKKFRMTGREIAKLLAYTAVVKCKGKGKGHPRTGHEAPEGEADL